ncbi:hypothetical protein [Nevskia ramosa]|uniref:hypothetical protein n=1 Tax=Nevskia ramosa TaxID=64002 RepID=UPI003D0CEC36
MKDIKVTTPHRVTAADVVAALKIIGRTVRVRELAHKIGTEDTRAVATAARLPAKDGRIRVRYPKTHGGASYRFVRLKPNRDASQ